MRHLLGGCRGDDVETISAVLARATRAPCRGAPRGAAAPFAPLASTARRGRVAARCPRGYRRSRRGYRAARRGDRRRRCPRRCCARWLSPSRVWLARRRVRARRARVSPYRARSGAPRRRRPASASVGGVARRGPTGSSTPHVDTPPMSQWSCCICRRSSASASTHASTSGCDAMGNSCMAAVDARDAQRSAATRRRTARVMTAASAVAEVTHAASIGEENVLFEGALFPRRWR